jgi:pyridoxal 5'-phosphate synthase pdxT subunit
MKIGVLALQGAFIEHIKMLQLLQVEACEVRMPHQLEGLDGLIIPGGESTTIGKLAVHYGLIEPLQALGKDKAIWGTCAGAILLSKDARRSQPLLNLMDITVERNAFGPQVASFEMDLDVPALASLEEERQPFPAIFIRAPLIESVGEGVESIAALPDGRVVAARQGRLLATAFHPELTNDVRFHRYFLTLAEQQNGE